MAPEIVKAIQEGTLDFIRGILITIIKKKIKIIFQCTTFQTKNSMWTIKVLGKYLPMKK